MENLWGLNKRGQEVREGDKLLFVAGATKTFIHAQFDAERGCWHKGNYYFYCEVVGRYG